jgi:hypothetical protein
VSVKSDLEGELEVTAPGTSRGHAKMREVSQKAGRFTSPFVRKIEL